MSVRKNLFTIGRKGHEGDENQLTEMLAYLLQEEASLISTWVASLGLPIGDVDEWRVETQRAIPGGGFLDLVLHAPSQALVIVESKLGSNTDFSQISKYIAYAKSVRVSGPKSLIFTTQHPEPWPPGVEAEAGDEVTLVLRRWQELGDFLAASEVQLAADFAEMLTHEGLAGTTAVERAASDYVALAPWGQVVRTNSAEEVLTATDFTGQCRQFINHITEAFGYFREIGYLSEQVKATGSPP